MSPRAQGLQVVVVIVAGAAWAFVSAWVMAGHERLLLAIAVALVGVTAITLWTLANEREPPPLAARGDDIALVAWDGVESGRLPNRETSRCMRDVTIEARLLAGFASESSTLAAEIAGQCELAMTPPGDADGQPNEHLYAVRDAAFAQAASARVAHWMAEPRGDVAHLADVARDAGIILRWLAGSDAPTHVIAGTLLGDVPVGRGRLDLAIARLAVEADKVPMTVRVQRRGDRGRIEIDGAANDALTALDDATRAALRLAGGSVEVTERAVVIELPILQASCGISGPASTTSIPIVEEMSMSAD